MTQARKLEEAAIEAAKQGKPFTTTPQERTILNLKYFYDSHSETLPETIAQYYKLKSTETKTLGWLRESEHPDGILCKPCPVCGYAYGSKWVYFPIPEEDEKIIYKLLEEV